MTHQNRWFAAVLASVVLTAPLAHAAGPAAPESAQQARDHFQRGVKLYEEEDYRAALIEFNRAYELAPNWAVLYNVGQAYYQLRDYANALRTMERYIFEGGGQIQKDRRAQVDKEMDELRGRVAHVTLQVSTPEAEITLDDVSLGKSPLATQQIIGSGRHKLVATKAGFVQTTKMVDIAGGDTITIALDMVEEPRSAPEKSVVREKPNYVPAYVSFALGGAGVVVGSVFGVVAMQNKSTLDKDCQNKGCPAGSQSDIDALSRNGTISTIGFVAGGIGLGAGLYFWLSERPKEQASEPSPAAPPQTRAKVEPWFGPAAAGLRGTF